jgi:ribosomal protein S27AE
MRHPLEASSQFTRTAIRTESRLLIQTICTNCGASKLIATHDETPEGWEEEHLCDRTLGLRWVS